jgi:hypothetical protein
MPASPRTGSGNSGVCTSPEAPADRSVTAQYRVVFVPLGGRLRNRQRCAKVWTGSSPFSDKRGRPFPEIASLASGVRGDKSVSNGINGCHCDVAIVQMMPFGGSDG